jgi:hypothetical protein
LFYRGEIFVSYKMNGQLAQFFPFLLGLLCVACPKANFSGNKPVATATSDQPSGTVNETNETTGSTFPKNPDGSVTGSIKNNIPVNVTKPKNPSKECATDNYRALRIVFVIDNSGSMSPPPNLKPTDAQYTSGSDPALEKKTVRGANEKATNRQEAIYKIILNSLEKDDAAKKQNPEFIGTDIALAYFPKNANEDVAVSLAGSPPLSAAAMTPISGISNKAQFLESLWNLLSFTHQGQGRTPYLAALKEGKLLLKDSKKADDTRRDLFVFLTDGLPSDESPSLVRKAKDDLKDLDIVYLRLYDQKSGGDSTFKAGLKEGFLSSSILWARKPNNPDKYSSSEFEKYWKDLIAIPEYLTKNIIQVENSSAIQSSLGNIIGQFQKC